MYSTEFGPPKIGAALRTSPASARQYDATRGIASRPLLDVRALEPATLPPRRDPPQGYTTLCLAVFNKDEPAIKARWVEVLSPFHAVDEAEAEAARSGGGAARRGWR